MSKKKNYNIQILFNYGLQAKDLTWKEKVSYRPQARQVSYCHQMRFEVHFMQSRVQQTN